MQPIKLNLKIYEGSTFTQVLRWESATKVYAPITNIAKSAPVVVTSASHGLPVGWRTRITNVQGMKEINSSETYHTVTETTSDTVTLNQINSLAYSTYTGGGVLEYNEPVNLQYYTARMQLRAKLNSPDILHTLTTENSGIVIDNTAKTITLTIPSSITETFDFVSAVYNLELIRVGTVINFATGNISLQREVTR